MKTKVLFTGTLILLFLFSACSKMPTEQDIKNNLNGYWKIAEVEFESGKAKGFTYSTTIDYIELEDDLSGYRMKVQPQIDNSYLSSGNKENFTIENRNDSLIFNYSTPMDKWSEAIISIDQDHFSVKNRQGKIYKYERFTSLADELDAHGNK